MMRRASLLATALVLTACPAAEKAPAAAEPAPAPASQPAKATSQPAAPASAPASGPSAQGTTPETRDQTDPDGVVRRGVAVAHDEAMTVGALLADAEKLKGQTVTLTGTVEQVCAKKGCWMALKGDEGQPTVRITSKGYAYFVPRTAAGMSATVTGELAVKKVDEATAKHYAEEADRDPATVKGDQLEVAVASVGLELRKP